MDEFGIKVIAVKYCGTNQKYLKVTNWQSSSEDKFKHEEYETIRVIQKNIYVSLN